MKTKQLIPLILLMAALLFANCKSCNCGFKPPKAKNTAWTK